MSRNGVGVERDIEALAAVEDEWDDLVRRQSVPSPTLTAAWLSAHAAGSEPRLVFVRRNGKLLSAGAFGLKRLGPLRVATWLGGSRLPGILGDPEASPELPVHVVETLRNECDVLWLTRVNPFGPTRTAISAALPWARTTPVSPSGYLTPLPPPRLEHARARAAYETRRAERKGAAPRIAVSRGPDEIVEAFERLVTLYLRRWSSDRDAGDAYSDVVTERARYVRLLPALAARNAARIAEVLDGETLLASVLGFVHGSGALFHTTATEAASPVRGPGHLAMLAWVEEAMNLGATEMYLGRGGGDPQGPKARLGATEIPLVDFVAASRRSFQRGLRAALAVRSHVKADA